MNLWSSARWELEGSKDIGMAFHLAAVKGHRGREMKARWSNAAKNSIRAGLSKTDSFPERYQKELFNAEYG